MTEVVNPFQERTNVNGPIIALSRVHGKSENVLIQGVTIANFFLRHDSYAFKCEFRRDE